MTRIRTIDKCVCCDRTGPIIGRGLIRACYAKRRRNGTLGEFPQDHAAQQRAQHEASFKGGAIRSQLSEGLIEDYAFLRANGESKEMAALRVGVGKDTARKYERRLRVAAGEVPLPDPNREPRSDRLVRVRMLVVEHVHRWPGVLFSINSLEQSLSSKLDCSSRTNRTDISSVVADLVSEGVLEVVPGRWSYSPEGAVKARRFRLITTYSAQHLRRQVSA